MRPLILKYTIAYGMASMHGCHPKILSVQEQRGQIVVWAEADPSEPEIVHKFPTSMTGDVAPDGVYLATVQMAELIVHVYYTGPE